MPFVSKAQAAKFRALVASGDMPQAVYDEWAKDTDFDHLPEHKRTVSYKKAAAYGKKIRRKGAR